MRTPLAPIEPELPVGIEWLIIGCKPDQSVRTLVCASKQRTHHFGEKGKRIIHPWRVGPARMKGMEVDTSVTKTLSQHLVESDLSSFRPGVLLGSLVLVGSLESCFALLS